MSEFVVLPSAAPQRIATTDDVLGFVGQVGLTAPDMGSSGEDEPTLPVGGIGRTVWRDSASIAIPAWLDESTEALAIARGDEDAALDGASHDQLWGDWTETDESDWSFAD